MCSTAKVIVSEVARKFGVAFREVNMATEEGLKEGLAHDVVSTPSVAIDGEVLVRGKLVSKEKLEEEVQKRLDKWRRRISSE
jgi:predicted thioredoxin/glutaredoxin